VCNFGCFQLVAAPFVAGALFFDPPLAFMSLIPGYIFGKFFFYYLLHSVTTAWSLLGALGLRISRLASE
jgi:hypothetical protein